LERSRGRRRCIKECAMWRKSLERSLMQRASDVADKMQPAPCGWV